MNGKESLIKLNLSDGVKGLCRLDRPYPMIFDAFTDDDWVELLFGKLNEEVAFNGAICVSKMPAFRNAIESPRWAYRWACTIGDIDYMRQFVTDSEYAFLWACNIGDRAYMKQFITDSSWALQWAIEFEDLSVSKLIKGLDYKKLVAEFPCD